MDVKLLFVCLGNICRSPAAHGIMEKLITERGLQDQIGVDSAGTYAGHRGELPDARMRAHAAQRGLQLTHRSRPVISSDFEVFDMILAMDDTNYFNLMQMAPDLDAQEKIFRMMQFSQHSDIDHVPDPYYGGSDGFEQVLDLLEDACNGLLDNLLSSNKQ